MVKYLGRIGYYFLESRVRTAKRSSPGVIETLSAGFELVNKMIWIMLLPIVVDILLWKGPLLSIAPAFKSLLAAYADALPQQLQQPEVSSSILGERVQSFEQLRQGLEAAAEHFNLLSLLVTNIAVVPSIGFTSQEVAEWVITISQPATIIAVAIVLELVGVLLGVLYLGLLAQQVRDGRIDPLRLARSVWRYWLSIVGFLLIVLGAALFVGVPAGLFAGVMFVISAGLGAGLMAVFATLLNVGLMLAMVYLFFLPDAVVVSEVGPIRAVSNSVKVVAGNFWSAIGLIVITFIIVAGTRVIWEYLSAETWGIVAAMVGNAYIASGLSAASMLFYKTRLAGMRETESLKTNETPA